MTVRSIVPTLPRRALLRIAAVLALALLALPVVAAAGSSDDRAASQMVLAADGTVLRTVAGPYADLFPRGETALPHHRVLALDVQHPDGTIVRWLVPGTEDAAAEQPAALVYEDAGGVAYLLWEGRHNLLYPRLYLIGFDSATFGERIEIGGNPFAEKGAPQLTITRDSGLDPSDHVTVLNVAWWEHSSAGHRKRYAPIVLRDGLYVGSTPVADLSAAFVDGFTGSPADAALPTTLVVQPSRDAQTAILGFTDPDSGRLITLAIEALPAALNDLADDVRVQIINTGLQYPNPAALADAVRVQIINTGARLQAPANPDGAPLDASVAGVPDAGTGTFHIANLLYLAEQAHALIVGSLAPESASLTTEALDALADAVRVQIINTGATFQHGGLTDASQGIHFLEVRTPDADGALQVRQVLKVAIRAERALPQLDVLTDAQGPQPSLYLSDDGREALLAWASRDGRSLSYAETQRTDGLPGASGTDWGPVRTLALDDGTRPGSLTLDEAQAMLARRMRER
ncbi:MAG: hypothetical protein AAF772_10910 [Acidobacteriota bacterium]